MVVPSRQERSDPVCTQMAMCHKLEEGARLASMLPCWANQFKKWGDALYNVRTGIDSSSDLECSPPSLITEPLNQANVDRMLASLAAV